MVPIFLSVSYSIMKFRFMTHQFKNVNLEPLNAHKGSELGLTDYNCLNQGLEHTKSSLSSSLNDEK